MAASWSPLVAPLPSSWLASEASAAEESGRSASARAGLETALVSATVLAMICQPTHAKPAITTSGGARRDKRRGAPAPPRARATERRHAVARPGGGPRRVAYPPLSARVGWSSWTCAGDLPQPAAKITAAASAPAST